MPLICSHLWGYAVGFSLGVRAANLIKKRLEGDFPTCCLTWGVWVDTQQESISLHPYKVLKGRSLLSDTRLGTGITRIPVSLVQKLRGGMGFWGSRLLHLRDELDPVGRFLSHRNGISTPKGTSSEAKNAIREFWESVEFLRALYGSSFSEDTCFNSSCMGALSLEAKLPLFTSSGGTCLDWSR